MLVPKCPATTSQALVWRDRRICRNTFPARRFTPRHSGRWLQRWKGGWRVWRNGERVPESARLSPWPSLLWFDLFLSLYMFQCLPFVNCHVVGLFTLDDVLGLVSWGMMHVAFEPDGRNDFLDDYTTNSAGFWVPFNVVTAPKDVGHWAHLNQGWIASDTSCRICKRQSNRIWIPTSGYDLSRLDKTYLWRAFSSSSFRFSSWSFCPASPSFPAAVSRW